jgi:hypothetical protein
MPAASRTGRPSGVSGSASSFAGWLSVWPRPCRQGGRQQFAAGFFAYRCDCCHDKVDRSAHELVVYCSWACRMAFRAGRRRLRRRHPSLRSFRRYREALLNARDPRGLTPWRFLAIRYPHGR